MNYSERSEKTHTFTEVSRVSLGRWHINGHDHWDIQNKTTVQLDCESGAVADAIVDFLAQLHNYPNRSSQDVELLQRFAGAMGLDYSAEG